MIISASRRTDIPAFYSSWFMNRIRDRFVLIRNPFNPTHIDRVTLDPANVDAIVFWTRNGEPLIPHLAELDRIGYPYYFQYTLVHYPSLFERSSLSVSEKAEKIRKLSQRVGRDKVIWRYDPIVLSNLTDLAYHQCHFQEIAEALRGYASRCVISFLDIYRKTRKAIDRLGKEKGVRVVDIHQDEAKARKIATFLAEIGRSCDLEIVTCAEPFDFRDIGIQPGKCIDDDLLNRLFGLKLSTPKDRGQRKLCRCVESKDIGAYDTCPYGCIYCYANSSLKSAQRNFQRHESTTPLLI